MKIVDLHGDLQELISAAIDQNRQAQKVIYTKYSPKLLSTCRQYISDVYQAEDVMITAFMKVFTNLSKFESRGNFEAWIRRIAVNESISFLRSTQKIRYNEEWSDQSTDDASDSQLMNEDIQAMIDELPAGCKMVFNLYAIEGYKHQEIADLLKISEGTSKSQLAYARKMLQKSYLTYNIIQK